MNFFFRKSTISRKRLLEKSYLGNHFSSKVFKDNSILVLFLISLFLILVQIFSNHPSFFHCHLTLLCFFLFSLQFFSFLQWFKRLDAVCFALAFISFLMKNLLFMIERTDITEAIKAIKGEDKLSRLHAVINN